PDLGSTLVEHRHADDADVAGLALEAGVRVSDRAEPEGRDGVARGAEALDEQGVVGIDDVAALPWVGGLAVDHVETVDRDDRLDAPAGGVVEPDAVALAGLADHVEAAILAEGLEGVAIAVDELEGVG